LPGCCSAQDVEILATTSPTATCRMHRWGHLKGTSIYIFEAVHNEIQAVFMETNRTLKVCQNVLHDIKSMCISKPAW